MPEKKPVIRYPQIFVDVEVGFGTRRNEEGSG